MVLSQTPVVRQIPLENGNYDALEHMKLNQRLTREMENRPAIQKSVVRRQSYYQKMVPPQHVSAHYRLGYTRSNPFKRFGINRQRNPYLPSQFRNSYFARFDRHQSNFQSFPSRYRSFGTWLTNQNWRGGRNQYFRGVNRRGRGKYRGRGYGMSMAITKLSKEELDRQIDEYMNKTNVKLDQDIDSYMQELNL